MAFFTCLIWMTGWTGSGDLVSLVPDRTYMVLVAPDVPELTKDLEQSPFAALFKRDDMKPLVDKLMEGFDWAGTQGKVREETGMTPGEILEQVKGGIVFCGFKGELGEDRFMLIADLGEGSGKIREMFQHTLEKEQSDSTLEHQVREIENEFRGVPVHVRQKVTEESVAVDEVWAISNGVLVLSDLESDVQAALARQLDGAAPSAKITESFTRVLDDQAFMVFDFTTMLSEQEEQAVNPMTAMLGLDKLKHFYAGFNYVDGVTRMRAGLTYEPDMPLASLFAFKPGGVPKPAFIPQDATSVTSIRFSIPEFVDTVTQWASRINPQAQVQYDQFVQQLVSQTGDDREVDLKRHLADPLGDEIVGFDVPIPAGLETDVVGPFFQVLTISVKDRQTLLIGLDELFLLLRGAAQMFPGLRHEPVEMSGTIVHSVYFEPGEGQEAIQAHVALVGDQLLMNFESKMAISQAIAVLNGSGSTFWDRADVLKASLAISPDPVYFGFLDINSGLTTFYFDLLKQIAGVEELPDAQAIADLFGPISFGLFKGDNGLSLEIAILPNQ